MSLSPGRKEAVPYRSHSGGLWEGSLQRGSPRGQWLLFASVCSSVAQLWSTAVERRAERSLSLLSLQVETPGRELPCLGLQEPMLQHSSMLAGQGPKGHAHPAVKGWAGRVDADHHPFTLPFIPQGIQQGYVPLTHNITHTTPRWARELLESAL